MSKHRETAHADMQQAISGLTGDIASGRVEDFILFHKNFALCAKFL
jgi:hypothetical protein